MAELIICCVVVAITLQILSNGDGIELDDLLGGPQLAALLAFLLLSIVVAIRAAHLPPGVNHYPAIGMLGIGLSGLLLVLFPERMPDVVRGGTMMTAFWGVFGWLLILLSIGVVVLLRIS
jgi:hypothetical protein